MIDNTALQAAIAYFEDAVRESDEIIEDCSVHLAAQLNEQKAHFEVALEVMRRVAANEPLTLDELWNIGDTPIWLVGVEEKDQWAQVQFVGSLTIGFNLFGDSSYWAFKTSSYGKTVFAYRHKPEGWAR